MSESIEFEDDDFLSLFIIIIFYTLIVYYKLRSRNYFESFVYLAFSFLHIYQIIPDYQNFILRVKLFFLEISDYVNDTYEEYEDNNLLFFFMVINFYLSAIILYTPLNKFIYLFILFIYLLRYQIIPNYQSFILQIYKPLFNNILEISKYTIIDLFKEYENDDFLSLFLRILYVSIIIYYVFSITWKSYNNKNMRNKRNYKQRIVNEEFCLCLDCYQPNTYYMYWCQHCNSKRFQKDFDKWTSGNNHVDKFIQESQLNRNYDEVLEWIPYNRLRNIQYLAKGGFSTIYKAI